MKSRPRFTAVLCLASLALGLAACAGNSGSGERQRVTRRERVYSPNAEPLSGGVLGHPTCEAAVGGWFDRLDVKHEGVLTREAFMADAQLQFDRMDLDHDGLITAAELATFRAPYEEAPDEPHMPRPADTTASDEGRGGGTQGSHRHGAGGSLGSGSSTPQERRPSSIDLNADPVMSADTSLRFKVSREDFINQAAEVFERLDTNHDGKLSRSEALGHCPKPPEE